ncbi:hypothetical protein ACFL3T_04270 [Patescibacteria group bacterium]
MPNFTEIQQTYVNKIQNQKLKNLVENSYTVFSLPEDEKNDFVIWMSLIHEDKNAENQIIQTLKEEQSIIKEEVEKGPGQVKEEQIYEIKSEQFKELKQSLQNLTKAAQTEKEKETKQKDESKMDNLLDQLNNI